MAKKKVVKGGDVTRKMMMRKDVDNIAKNNRNAIVRITAAAIHNDDTKSLYEIARPTVYATNAIVDILSSGGTTDEFVQLSLAIVHLAMMSEEDRTYCIKVLCALTNVTSADVEAHRGDVQLK